MAEVEVLHKDLYHPINPEQGYDRKDFVKGFSQFSDLEKHTQALIKDSRDPSAISDLGGLLHSDSNFYEEMSNPGRVARVEADRAHSHGIESMAKYVKGNLNDFLGLCDDNNILNFVTNVPIYKTGNEEHDEFVDSLSLMKEISEAVQSKDPAKTREYVGKKLENVPQWLKESFAILQSDSGYVHALFQQFAAHDQEKFARTIHDKNGKVKRNFLEKVVKDSLKKAYEQHKKETNESDKNDIWKADIRPYYITLAKLAYPKEKAAEKKDENPERAKRKAERAVLGMAA